MIKLKLKRLWKKLPFKTGKALRLNKENLEYVSKKKDELNKKNIELKKKLKSSAQIINNKSFIFNKKAKKMENCTVQSSQRNFNCNS